MVIFFSLLSLIIQLTVGKGVDELGRSNPQCFVLSLYAENAILKERRKRG